MGYYISLNDSSMDPTYASADECDVIESDDTGENPCVGRGVKRFAPVLPKSREDILAFCAIIGWAVECDNEGNLVLYPGV